MHLEGPASGAFFLCHRQCDSTNKAPYPLTRRPVECATAHVKSRPLASLRRTPLSGSEVTALNFNVGFSIDNVFG
jgi:hypothetical protein